MIRTKTSRRDERGAALAQFAIGATIFFTVLFAVLEVSRLLWTHNTLSDAVRLGARYAVINLKNELSPANGKPRVKNVVAYGVPDPAGGAMPVVSGLTPDNVDVVYSANFGVKQGTVTVRIINYQFIFSLPLVSATITMPDYKTTLTCESVRYTPPPIP